ncbi:putative transport protein [Pedobacter sp. UYP24]
MILYNNQLGILNEIKEKPFKLERDIQTIFERNLQTIMELSFVKSEFTIKNKRIDTLAFDKQSNAFIIIEYKRDKNFSVVDQGFTYLSLMLENKADFIVEYNESLKQNLRRGEIDWSQTRVVFVSTGFTENQIQATNFKDIAIELWEIKQFENGTVTINPIKKSQSAESIKPITQNKQELKKVNDEIKVYTEEFHLERYSDQVIELYEQFKTAICNLHTDITIVPKKLYIAFKLKKNLVDIVTENTGLKIFINLRKGQLDDPKNIVRDVSSIGHWGNGDYELSVKDTKDIEYIMSLIKQTII